MLYFLFFRAACKKINYVDTKHIRVYPNTKVGCNFPYFLSILCKIIISDMNPKSFF